MKSAAHYTLLATIICVLSHSWIISVHAFVFSPKAFQPTATIQRHQYHQAVASVSSRTLQSITLNANNDSADDGGQENNDASSGRMVANDLGLDIVRGGVENLSDDTWGDIEGGAPTRWMVMKDVST